ncbi:MAG: peptidylprolyl isomerase [Planctomycetota bacterium]|nr:peptidylprolyl isomerase [Planctomycetota bacterium]
MSKTQEISRLCCSFLILILAYLTPLSTFAQDEGGQKKEEKVKKAKVVTDPAIASVQAYIKKNVADKKINKEVAGWKSRLPKFPTTKFTEGTTYIWNLATNKGDVKVQFMPSVAPNHVANFIYLTELGFFDDLKFHRVITGFMAQGGCPQGSGRGNPGYRFDGEYAADVKHTTNGLLSMANAGPGTDGSQFFLTFVPTPWLDGKHTIFGKMISGESTLKALEAAGSRGGRPSEELKINKATITVVAAKKTTKVPKVDQQ